ncbi:MULTISPECIES: ABC transporter substrate-binding protein [unclassified Bradyrhizobium]|uniref:ABC transporter substrate-binding protein n=1 Tax=unclassified Bradyrhizobium TaxID=2631580 RepID=UPI001BADB1B0|nr:MULTISPECIES: extracellular solute-binding protein [unclassified Bradyrhizobium]MBR1229179.1 extracellular solute-binding protein [Bradyrhizobium sp. AUGA SZCCT0176]MBR1301787.1 extracellular solute-binding protein [Bradyrhizobium sp. AUGA SZCCT0042]
MMHRLLMLSLCAALVSTAAFAQAPAGKVTVVTSFAKDVTDPVKKAFETATPGVTLEVQNRNTNAGVKYLEETKSSNQVDLFWASAPDAFEVLKGKGLLQKYAPKASGIPEKIGQFPINDPAGFYFGFAASGYGIMWNERYVKANKLPDPREWQDLAKPVYYDHVSIAAPSRSGTTHLTVEAVLQGEGWAKGWGTIKAMAGNFRNITERSFGVPEAVNSGQVGYGIVIDFFAFSAQASGFPVKFIYPTVTTIVPANVGIVANAPNKAAAEAFVEFLLSPAGQQVLFEPGIRRLPVNPDVYAKAPADYPNPFKDPRLNAMIKFDVAKSEARNDVVDVLFDQLISFQLDSLKAATKAIHEAEAALAKKDNAQARALVAQARELIAAMPVDEAAASAKETASAFTGGKQKGARQAELEQQWAVFAKERYAQAQAKAEEATKLAK